jgi:class 3 adenylate cyclase
LRQSYGLTPSTMLPPGMYPGVVTLMADLCGFSSYVKETKEDSVIRHCLTTFYSKARSAILNTGGMMYQFVGDEVIGLYGIPDRPEGYLEAAFDCAKALVDIGNSVSRKWQRQLDSVQKAHGVHIGICMGAMQVVSLRPFSRTHISGIGDVINLAARLLADAGPGQIMASNAYRQALSPAYRDAFHEAAPVDAKNIGTVLAWQADMNAPAIQPAGSSPLPLHASS